MRVIRRSRLWCRYNFCVIGFLLRIPITHAPVTLGRSHLSNALPSVTSPLHTNKLTSGCNIKAFCDCRQVKSIQKDFILSLILTPKININLIWENGIQSIGFIIYVAQIYSKCYALPYGIQVQCWK